MRKIEIRRDDLCECVHCTSRATCILGKYMNEVISILKNAFLPEYVLITRTPNNEVDENEMYNRNALLIEGYGMRMRDFLFNCILAIYSKIYENVENDTKIKDVLDYYSLEYGADITRDQLSSRQKRITKTKRDVIPVNDNIQYLKNKLYEQEMGLVLHEVVLVDEMDPSEQRRQNPLLKLASFENISEKNYTRKHLEELIDYYNAIYKHIDSLRKYSKLEKALLFYNLELNLRFETYFKVLTYFKKFGYDDSSRFSAARGFGLYPMIDASGEYYFMQNRVFFGIDTYINTFIGSYPDEIQNTFRAMSYISSLINMLIERLDIPNHLTSPALPPCHLEAPLYEQAVAICNMQKNIKDIKIKDFIRMYTPDYKSKD